MKDSLTNIDIYVLSHELRANRFSKIVRVPGGYKLKFSGGADLLVVPGRFIIPTSYVVEAGRPDNLAIISRKRLGNARILGFEQVNFDRILAVRTDRGSIILESFGDGNVVLTDENNVVIYALHEREWRDRSIRRGEPYVPPPPPRISPDVDFTRFAEIFTGKDVVRSLVRAGIPPVYAEEICALAGVDKNLPVSELDEGVLRAIYSAFSDLLHRLDRPEPAVVRDGDEIVDVLPIPLSRYDGYDIERYETFSEALDVLTPRLFTTGLQQAQEKREKRSMVDFWRSELESARKELSELEAMISAAYEHSYLLEQAIAAARSGKPVESVGPFRLKGYNGREVVYEFTPQP